MFDVDQSSIIDAFSRVRKYGCSFANKARLVFATPPWQLHLTLEENLEKSLGSLNEFIERQEDDKLDAWVFAISDPSYARDLDLLAQTTKRLLIFLSLHDPAATDIMKQPIEVPEWEFCYSDVNLFVMTFAPCYPQNHPRSSHSEIFSYYLFQPDASFKRAYKVTGEKRDRLRSKIRKEFVERNMPLDETLMNTEIEAYKYVKPINLGDSPVKWWL